MDAGSGNLPSWMQSILALLGGGALVQGLNWFSSHRKNSAEAEKMSAEAIKTEAETEKIATEKQKLLSDLADGKIKEILELYAADNALLRTQQADSEKRCDNRLSELREDYRMQIEEIKSLHRDFVAQTEAERSEMRQRLDAVEQFRGGFGL